MFQVLPAPDYRDALVRDLQTAKHRVVIVVHLFLWDDDTQPVFDALEAAARRGVQMQVVFDTFTRYSVTRGLLPYNPLRSPDPKRLAATLAGFDRLRAAGAEVVELGSVGRFNPYRGRCHAKFSVVDDIAYCFGGTNLYREGITQSLDYMTRLEHAGLASELCATAATMAGGGLAPDHRWRLDAASELLVDHGQPRASIIYDQACAYAAQAKRVYYVSQFYPTGRLAGLLRRSDTTCYTNRPRHTTRHVAAMLIADRLKTGLTNHYRRDIFLHAKFILFELRDGTRALLAGSHNFSWPGVLFGTQEVAVASTDPKLWQALYDYLQSEVAAR
ncbi:MAG TPA: phospholipase D-like domain-containing protein [Candidatus Saccharimonas sp.]|nr:phospholipase D-like domain-containing protein [Candidatus Saccharimonas sp.]